MQVDHLGIAVINLDSEIQRYVLDLGYTLEVREVVPDQEVEVAFLKSAGMTVELIMATTTNSPFARFMAKKGPGLHHLAYRVSDLPAALKEFEAKGYRLIDRVPRPGAGGKKIAFIHPASVGGVLMELCAY